MSTVIDVAAAVIQNSSGQVLLSCRPPQAPYAGFWEFPGGKFEPGEQALACLVRELREELGIEVTRSYPWITRVYAYPDKTVRLHFFRVFEWRGAPQAREGQGLSWQDAAAVTVEPLLPANAPILAALALPARYAITQAMHYGEAEFLVRLQRALSQGLRLVQIREKEMPSSRLAEFARTTVALARQHGARVLINGDIALAQAVGADGVHLSAQQLLDVRQLPLPFCAASCHNAAELAQAARLGCAFVVVSPVLPTATHPGAPPLGWEVFAGLIAQYPLPVYALGGMTPSLLTDAMRHGAHGIALLRAAWA